MLVELLLMRIYAVSILLLSPIPFRVISFYECEREGEGKRRGNQMQATKRNSERCKRSVKVWKFVFGDEDGGINLMRVYWC